VRLEVVRGLSDASARGSHVGSPAPPQIKIDLVVLAVSPFLLTAGPAQTSLRLNLSNTEF